MTYPACRIAPPAAWMSQLREEVTFIVVRGRLVARRKRGRRQRSVRQAEHPDRGGRGHGQQPLRGGRHAAGRWTTPRRYVSPSRSLRTVTVSCSTTARGEHAPRGGPAARRLSVANRSVEALPNMEGTDARSRGDRPIGLLRGRQRQDFALLSGKRRKRGHRGHRQGAGSHPARHGHGRGQDVTPPCDGPEFREFRLSPALEERPQVSQPVTRFPRNARSGRRR